MTYLSVLIIFSFKLLYNLALCEKYHFSKTFFLVLVSPFFSFNPIYVKIIFFYKFHLILTKKIRSQFNIQIYMR